MKTFHQVFENQPIATEKLTQHSRYKRAEINLPADEKGPQQGDPGRCLLSRNPPLFSFQDFIRIQCKGEPYRFSG